MMKFFNNLRLRNKLLLGFSIPAILIGSLCGLFVDSVSKLVKASHWVDHTHVAVKYGDTLISSMVDMETGLRGYLLAGDSNFLDPYASGQIAFDDTFKKAKQHVSDNKVQLNRLDQIKSLKAAWLSNHAEPAIELRKAANASKETSQFATGQNVTTVSDIVAFIGTGKGKQAMDQLRSFVAEFTEAEHRLIEVRKSEAAQLANQTTNIVFIGATITLAILIAVALLITRSVTVPMSKALKLATGIASGDLSGEYLCNNRDEAGMLLRKLNSMQDELKRVIGTSAGVSESVASGARQISQNSITLKQRTDEQASSLEQTASSTEEISVTIKTSAEFAQKAIKVAEEAKREAKHGGDVVSNAVSAMAKINSASNKIASINNVIDEIAFQTNLLALNAAVEAARAGDQGRGFAVVASEVRSLAGRSAEAAAEIKGLIDDSVAKVKTGTEFVNQSGEALQKIVESVETVNDIVSDIATAGQEQSRGVDIINESMTQMNGITRDNAGLAEEATQAGQLMAEQAGELARTLSYFHTDGKVATSNITNLDVAPSGISQIKNENDDAANASAYAMRSGER
ncbi:MAG: methyl-accepting chemotaxis protein [Granulosicoccus sp.]